jgi:DNA-binding NarL/FixJ family response regulator
MLPIRVILADDHELITKGFQLMLAKQTQVDFIDDATNGRELLQKVEQHKPDVVITDIQMPVMDGIEACRQIKEKHPQVEVIALSTFGDDHFVIDMLEAGARGYLLKNTNKTELVNAIKAVYEGDVYFSKSISNNFLRLLSKSKYNPYKATPKVEFTEKEKEVITYICQEFSNKEIADKMEHSVRTIEGYREKIFEKTGARNIAGIVVYAIKHNLFKIQ